MSTVESYIYEICDSEMHCTWHIVHDGATVHEYGFVVVQCVASSITHNNTESRFITWFNYITEIYLISENIIRKMKYIGK